LFQLALVHALALSAFGAQDFSPSSVHRTATDGDRNYARIAFNFYDQKDHGGNPNKNDSIRVWEPVLLVVPSMSDKWTGKFKLQGDVIASSTVGTDATTTASGAKRSPLLPGEAFFRTEAAAFYAWSDQLTVGGGLIYSTEPDYKSRGVYLQSTFDLPSHNDTFLLKATGFFDALDLNFFDDTSGGSDHRRTLALGPGWTHIFGPGTVGMINWDFTSQQGFLATPINSVKAAGTEVREILPDSRIRNAIHARVRQLMSPTWAVEPGIGYYHDSWGATAWNFEITSTWEARPAELYVEPSFRFHTQTAVDYFVPDSAASIPEFRTQDADLDKYMSGTFGLNFILPHTTWTGEYSEFNFGADLTWRSDGLDSFTLTVGYMWKY